MRGSYGMKSPRLLIHGLRLLGTALVAMAFLGCMDRERVVVRERPAVVHVYAPPPPIVRERIVIRP
jgi:hypothetical protein